MNAFTIAGLVGILVVVVGMLLAGLMMWLSKLVTNNELVLAAERVDFNPAFTMGHEIPLNGSKDEQRQAARKAAARRAAAQPRWANATVGSLGASTLRTASENLAEDPQSAVRIAEFHTWQGARSGLPAPGALDAPVTTVAATTVVTKSPDDLKPGIDYPFINITDDMAPAELRKARIANAKARSAAIKALKAAGGTTEVSAAAAAPVAAAGAVAVQAAPSVTVPEPDYIEITDDMAPDEIRKARISNAKTKSAYTKALKAAGATAPVEAASAPAAVAAAAPVAAPTPPAAELAIPKPDLIDITDDMAPDEVRRARISNAKATSAFKKALKEAGIDPNSVNLS